MASENPDDKDGSKNSGEKKYRGVWKVPSGRFQARCRGKAGSKAYIGTYATAADAARAYDERSRELYGAQAVLNFPDFRTDGYSLPATESTLHQASGRSIANTENKVEKRKDIIISDLDADTVSPYDKEARNTYGAKAMHNFPHLHTEDDLLPATKSALPTAISSVSIANKSEFANIPSEQHLVKSVWSEVCTTGSIIGSSGSTIIAFSEPPAVAEEVILPTATNNTLPLATSSVRGVASRSEFANLPSKQPVVESVINPGVEPQDLERVPINKNSPVDIEIVESLDNQEEFNNYVEYLNRLLSDEEGSNCS